VESKRFPGDLIHSRFSEVDAFFSKEKATFMKDVF